MRGEGVETDFVRCKLRMSCSFDACARFLELFLAAKEKALFEISFQCLGFSVLQFCLLCAGVAARDQMESSGLVEAAAGAVFGVVVAFGLAFAHLFGVAGGFIGAGFLFGRGEDALFGAA
jgi:hypothetical protein